MILISEIVKICFRPEQEAPAHNSDLKQWDRGKRLEISGLDVTENVQVHFSLTDSVGTAKCYKATVEDGKISVGIPQFILAKEKARGSSYYAYAWVYVSTENHGETIKKIIFTIAARAKPEDYISDPEDIRTWEEHEKRLSNLEKGGASDEAIASAVKKYLDENPIEAVTNKQIESAVEAYLLKNPVTGGTISAEQIAQAVSEYMKANPIETGATKEQAEQIEKNKQDIGKISEQINDIPKVFIDGVIPTTKDDVLAEMTYISMTDQFHAYLKIKCQGSSSMAYAKKNFTIKMYSDEARETKLKKAFKDWGSEQNKYVLKANYIDHSHARNIVSARLWNEVVASRSDYDSLPTELKTSPNNGAIDGFPIKLYANGTYQGIYTWNIGKDDWLWGMDEDNPNHILLCAESNTNDTFAETACNFRALWDGDESSWGVEVGSNSNSLKNGLNNLIGCIKDTDDETFIATIENHLDLQSAIDYWIHQYIICGLDGLAKNMLLGTYNLQTGIEANQMLKYPYYHILPFFESNGVRYTDNGDNSITVQGTTTTAESSMSLYVNKDGARLPLNKGTYTLSINASDNYRISGAVRNINGEVVHWINLNASSLSKTFTIDEDGFLDMTIVIDPGVTIDETVYPMLNAGDTALPFESYTNISAKWIMGAYDMDSTFGLWWNGNRFVATNYRCPEDYQEKYNLLFERITELYAERVKERYAELRNTVYSTSNMFTHFERFMDNIGKDLYAEDLEVYSTIPSGSTNNIKQIRDYIRDRLEYCDGMFYGTEIDYTLNPLANVTWYDDKSYKIYDGIMFDKASEHCTSKFNLQDCVYKLEGADGATYTDLYIWDGSGVFLGLIESSTVLEYFTARSDYQYALKFYQESGFDSTSISLMPYNNSVTATESVSVTLSELTFTDRWGSRLQTDIASVFGNDVSNICDKIKKADTVVHISSRKEVNDNYAVVGTGENAFFPCLYQYQNQLLLITQKFSNSPENAKAFFEEHNTTLTFNN